MLRYFWPLLVPMLFFFALGNSGFAGVAENKPADVVMYRQLLMKSLDVHMSGIAALIENKIDHWGHARAHAEAIERFSREMPTVFPHWTGPQATETLALSSVWKNWREFQAASTEMNHQAVLLVEATGSIDRRAIERQYRKVRQTCDSCHSAFMKAE